MSYLKLTTVVCAIFGVMAFACGSEADELREKAAAMQREAAELAEQGHKKEAANLKQKALAMLEEAEQIQKKRPQRPQAEILELKKRLVTLQREEAKLDEAAGMEDQLAEVRGSIRQTEDELRHLTSDRPRHDRDPHHRERARHNDDTDHRGPRHEVAERLEHMHVAIEHLHHAGLHDIAEHVAERHQATERELHEHHPEHRDRDPMRHVLQQLEELRHEIGRLHDQVNELRNNR